MMDESDPDAKELEDTPLRKPKPAPETLLLRGLKLKCPRCGDGHLYASWARMQPRCEVCGLHFLRGPGYYLGSTYLNYGLTAGIITATFLIGRIAFGISSRQLLWPLMAFCVIFPILIFRHARALWLALDCQFDSSVLQDDEDLRDQ